MIAMLMVMSGMDLSHDLLGYGWFGSGRVLGLVDLATGVRPMSSVWFGYRGETYELCLVLATGVRPVSSVWFWLQG
jgi:hypothetical protein